MESALEHVHVINAIRVPPGMEDEALRIRDTYIAYFRTQPGFVRSTMHRSVTPDSSFEFLNTVVWDSQASLEAVVNRGFDNAEGLNSDGMKVLGQGFPAPIEVHPGRYEVVRDDAAPSL